MKIILSVILFISAGFSDSSYSEARGVDVNRAVADGSQSMEQTVGIFYTQQGGDQAFDLYENYAVFYKNDVDKFWILPVLNGSAERHALINGHCDILLYRNERDYVTPLQLGKSGLPGLDSNECIGFESPILADIDGDKNKAVVFVEKFRGANKGLGYRVMVYSHLEQEYCYADELSSALTVASRSLVVNDKNAGAILNKIKSKNIKMTCPVKLE